MPKNIFTNFHKKIAKITPLNVVNWDFLKYFQTLFQRSSGRLKIR